MSLERTMAAAVVDLIRPLLDAREPAVFSLQQAARYAHLSTTAVKKLIDDGELPCVRVGSQYRVARAQIDALYARGAVIDLDDRDETEAA